MDETLIEEDDDATVMVNNSTIVDEGEIPSLFLLVTNSKSQTKEFILTNKKDSYILGRANPAGKAADNDVPVDDKYISRRHCRIFIEDGKEWHVEDYGSTNGTELNGEPLRQSVTLTESSKIRIGTTAIIVEFISSDSLSDEQAKKTIPIEDGEKNKTEIKVEEDDDATVVAPISTGNIVEADETIVVSTSTKTITDEATIVTEQNKPSIKPSTLLQEKQQAINVAGRNEVPESFPKLAKELVSANLLLPRKVESLLRHALTSGHTFFRSLMEDRSIRYHKEICQKISDLSKVPLIEDEQEILQDAVETQWLTYTQSANAGAILLQNEDGEIDRYATIAPFDLLLQDWLMSASGNPDLYPVLVLPELFLESIRRLKINSEDVKGDTVDTGVAIEIDEEEEHKLREQLEEIDIPQMVNYFIHRASAAGASDIHIEPTEDMLLVRNRVDGILHEESALPKEISTEIASRLKIMSDMDVAEKRRPQDGRFGRIISGHAIDVRVSSFPTVYGEKIVMRLLDKNALRPSPESLGLMDRDLRLLKDKISAPYGLIMISGPTGSGKTTTLYSCLGNIDKESKNVLTVEDPVEYRLNGVHQMQVNSKIGLTFASGLRTILRQDPDVIMVGECRDTETAGMAVQASLTGHIVLSTIHTNDAVGVVTRMLDMGIEPFLVGTSLSMSIAQRLVRTVCHHCKSEVPGEEILEQLQADGVSEERLQQLEIEIDPYLDYAQGAGCSYCRDTGYLGRQAVFEVFEMTNEARNMILSDDFNADNLRAMSKEMGMTTLIRHGLKLVEEEVTTFSEIIRVLGES